MATVVHTVTERGIGLSKSAPANYKTYQTPGYVIVSAHRKPILRPLFWPSCRSKCYLLTTLTFSTQQEIVLFFFESTAKMKRLCELTSILEDNPHFLVYRYSEPQHSSAETLLEIHIFILNRSWWNICRFLF